MSKDNKRQKNKEGEQLKLFTPFGEPIWETSDGIATGYQTGLFHLDTIDYKQKNK